MILAEGTSPDAFYIVESGCVEVIETPPPTFDHKRKSSRVIHMSSSDSENHELVKGESPTQLVRGDIFGESALRQRTLVPGGRVISQSNSVIAR